MQKAIENRTAAVVLCGGQSRRMGQDKAWIELQGEYMLQRIVRVVGQVIPRVVVSAAKEQELPPLPANVTIVRDLIPNAGPLAGLAAAFEWLDQRVDSEFDAEAIFVCACDFPMLRAEIVRAMKRHYEQVRAGVSPIATPAPQQDATTDPPPGVIPPDPNRPLALVPVHNDRPQPLLAVYSIHCGPILQDIFAKGERRAQAFASACDTTFLPTQSLSACDPNLESFANINTPDDLDRYA